jgi:hypothetical protein
MSQPKLVEYNTLKKLLNNSYNEGSTPFTQISKYTQGIKDNWFNIVVIIFILILIILIVNKKSKKECDSTNQIDNLLHKKIKRIPNQKEKKYNNINEYYTENFKLYK